MGWGEAVGLLLLAVAVGLIVWPAAQLPESDMPVPPGTPLPPLMVAGWVDGNSRSVESLRGKVVVVDCWATWCPPCREAMPKMAKLYAQYQPLGVEFIGLTPEGETELKQIETFLGKIDGVTWPIGYGANPMFDMLGVDAFPTLIVFDAAGRAVWSGHDAGSLPDVLDQTIASEGRGTKDEGRGMKDEG